MTTTPTIYDIKQDTFRNSPYFFSPKTLKFFGQTLKSFKVKRSPSGRIFIYAKMLDQGRFMGYTFREYVNHNLLTPRNDDDTMFNDDCLQDILDYISQH